MCYNTVENGDDDMSRLEGLVQRVLWKNIIMSLLFLVIGILLVVSPVSFIAFVAYFIGIILILNGILCLFDIGDQFRLFDPLIMGIMSLLFGIVILINPSFFTSIVPILLGFWFIILGVIKCRLSFVVKDLDDGDWVLVFIMSMVTIFCGMLLILFPNLSEISITILLGVLLIIYSVNDIINFIVLKKKVHDIAGILKKWK